MATLQKLYDDTDTVEFDPGDGYIEPGIASISRQRSQGGTSYSYKFFAGKGRYEIPVRITVKVDAEQLNTWFDNNTELKFYYDLVNSPALYKLVHIVNANRPVNIIDGTWKTWYDGDLILEEV